MSHICISEHDMKRLLDIINNPGKLDLRESENLDLFRDELTSAQVLSFADISSDMVTMNSTIRIADMESGEEEEYTLVFPADADISSGKISVLAPIGTAMLGCPEGDTVIWRVPDGRRQLLVKKLIYQPEASGDYNL